MTNSYEWHGSAVLSPCGRYRYRLQRTGLCPGSDRVLFVMLNPSKADGRVDDPTIRRCMGFARGLGCAELEVVNLFAWRATKPAELHGLPDPVGSDNDWHIADAAARVGPVVCAWGASRMVDRRRLHRVLELLPRPLHCLAVTKAGAPKHPLYVPAAAPLCVWRPA